MTLLVKNFGVKMTPLKKSNGVIKKRMGVDFFQTYKREKTLKIRVKNFEISQL